MNFINLVLTTARWCWRHKVLIAFVTGLVLMFNTNNQSGWWRLGVALVLIGGLPMFGLFSGSSSIWSIFSRRREDEHQRGSKIVSAGELSRRVNKN
jgi:hypothetical protein